MPTQAQPQTTRQVDLRPLLARITRDQGPEYEQTISFFPNQQISTPTSIRTDRKIKTIDFHLRMRITNGATGPTLRTGPPLLGSNNSNILFGLFQQVTIRGQHLKYGSQTLIQMRGEAAAEYLALLYPNYIPQYAVAPNGGPLVKFGPLSTTLAQFNDIDVVLPIPLYPPDLSAADAAMYCVHGPDWPGNLFIDLLFADGTALATANAPTTFTAFGASTGSGSVDILSERPLLGKDYMSAIRGALTYRIVYTQQPSNAVSVAGGTGVKLSDLTVGKDTSRIFLKTGIQGTGQSAGVIAFSTLSDLITTRTFFSLDTRGLRFQNANGDPVLQDYMGRSYGRTIPAGYRMIDFIRNVFFVPSNPKMAFGSSQLTAARKFELDADTVAAANQIAEVTQEMLLGAPGITTS
jgi:hypothetical protein